MPRSTQRQRSGKSLNLTEMLYAMFQAWTSQTWTKCGSSLVIQSANWAISKNLSSSCKSLARIQRALEIKPRKPPRATVVKASTGGAFSNGGTRVRPSRSRSKLSDFCTCDAPVSSAAASRTKGIFLSMPVIRAKRVHSPQSTVHSQKTKLRAVQVRAADCGLWTEDYSRRSLRCRQFAPGEDGDANDAEDAAQQQHNLSEGQANLPP